MIGQLAFVFAAVKLLARRLLPVTEVHLGRQIFPVYVPLDEFVERWITAKRTYRFVELRPGLWANPLQIAYAKRRR